MTDDRDLPDCELCDDRQAKGLIDSDAGLWPTRVPVCYSCWGRLHMGAGLQVNVRRMA